MENIAVENKLDDHSIVDTYYIYYVYARTEVTIRV